MTADPSASSAAPVLVIGVTGFVGGHLAAALLQRGRPVRGMTRAPARAAEVVDPRVQLVQGDMLEEDALSRATEGAAAVCFCAHTLSPQADRHRAAGFMDIEATGLRHLVRASRRAGVRRILYVTSIGVGQDAPSSWLRERHQLEQLLLRSGLAVTVFRPGMIVGVGGQGFDRVLAGARRRTAVSLAPGQRRMRTIAVADLVHYLVQALDEPRAYGEVFEVGTEDVLTTDQLTDLAADALGRRHPRKLHLPLPALRLLSPVVERLGRLPRGAVAGLVDGAALDLVGDPRAADALFGPPPTSYRQALRQIAADAG